MVLRKHVLGGHDLNLMCEVFVDKGLFRRIL
jgi:hypothetical protein